MESTSVMIETLVEWDKKIFLYLNGFHSPFWDNVMYWISEKYIWIPFYLLIIVFLIYKFKMKSILYIAILIAAVGVADSLSVHLFKNVFERYRPCRVESDIDQFVHIVKNHCGGKYGFISSHATNSFCLATLVSLYLRKHLKFIILFMVLWASIVSYSRIYLGVHYPADVLFGAFFGMFVGVVFYYVLKFLESILYKNNLTEN